MYNTELIVTKIDTGEILARTNIKSVGLGYPSSSHIQSNKWIKRCQERCRAGEDISIQLNFRHYVEQSEELIEFC